MIIKNKLRQRFNQDKEKNPMRIAVASGKGGTGKTTVSVNLFHFMTKHFGHDILLVDCDVEEPNTALFFSEREITDTGEVYRQIPVIDTESCTFCKKCAEWCAFNAITIVASKRFAIVNESACHSCGACIVACSHGAISEKPLLLGSITTYKTAAGQKFTEGRLNIGSPMQALLIKKLKEAVSANCSAIIYDAPPGTSCPVVQTLSDTDYIVLVTEPTPFGLSDLKITVELVRELKIPFGVIINKSGLGSDDVYEFIKANNIVLLGEIPFSKAYARNYSKGNLLTEIPIKTEQLYLDIIRQILASI